MDIPDPGIKLGSYALQEDFLPLVFPSGQVPTPYPVVIPEGVRHPAQLALNLFRVPKWENHVSETVTKTDGHCY